MKRGINKVPLMKNVGNDPKLYQIDDTTNVVRLPLDSSYLATS